MAMVIRLRSSSGTARIEVPENETLSYLVPKIQEKLNLDQFMLSRDPQGTDLFSPKNLNVPLKSMNIKHGDMLYVQTKGKEEEEPSIPNKSTVEIEEDPIDKEIGSMDGWIQRPRDERMCNHGPNGKCNWCMPIAPWSILEHDPWKKDRVKWIPFHSYLRKIQANSGCRHPPSQKCLNCKSIEVPSYRVKPCNKHPPWPDGICTECDPGSCRLDFQPYRHVDHMEVESIELVDKFIQAWRDTRNQRYGFLYGRYVPDPTVPLGIRAVISAIYEPPQKSNEKEAVFDNEKDHDIEKVNELARSLGLQQIGFIWTDLQIDRNGKLVNSRNKFGELPLTSRELFRMAKFQNKHPSPCRQSSSGYCGSKFISALVTGTDDGRVEIQVFQASDQCMALVKDGIITVSDNPQFMRLKRLRRRYLPDVVYTTKNEYNREVLQKANPNMPLEFFIIRLSEGAAKNPNPFFKSIQFPIENRSNKNQSLEMVNNQINSAPLHSALSDFHLLIYLAKKIDQNSMNTILEYILTQQNEDKVRATLKQILENVTAPMKTTVQGHPNEAEWISMLTSMGYSATQAQEALWATNYQGIENAIDFLSRS